MNPITHDPISEAALCAAALVSGPAADLAASIVTHLDFFDPALGHVFELIEQARWEKRPHDAQAVAALILGEGGNPGIVADLVTEFVTSEASSVRFHAEKVREYGTRRRIVYTARSVLQRAENPETPTATLAADAVHEMQQVRDSGASEEWVFRSLGEVMSTEDDDDYDWVVPGLLERGDRFVLTGAEGLGKSVLLRQMAICTAAGINPFDHHHRFDPVRVVMIDAENTERQFRRKGRAIRNQSRLMGHDPDEALKTLHPGRIDITQDRHLSMIHRALDRLRPDVLVIGPLYKLVPRAIQTDDEAAPVLVALDSIRDRGVTLIIEAHAGHGTGPGGDRNWRPRGSAALMGWPEFGYGLAPCFDVKPNEPVQARLLPWRGDRDERPWPTYLKRGGMFPWTEIKTSERQSEGWTPHSVVGE